MCLISVKEAYMISHILYTYVNLYIIHIEPHIYLWGEAC